MAEVLQIFTCIVAQIPVMRSPIQILYLILATDLAPSVALGLEPGMPGIMNERPRPKTQPIVLPWMWQCMVVNSISLAAVILGVYVWALEFYIGETDLETIAKISSSTDGDGT